MKYFPVLLFIILNIQLIAQVKGNKKIVTREFPLENLSSLEVNLYSKVEVDCADQEEKITITADENLIDLIQRSVEDGHLLLTQKDWLQPSQNIEIKIGAPKLERIQHAVHESTLVKNISRPTFRAMAIIGKLRLQGQVAKLHASAEIGEIDAQEINANKVEVNLWSHGKIVLGTPTEIKGVVKEDGYVVYSGVPKNIQVKTSSGGRIQNEAEFTKNKEFDTKFINLKVKNNSWNRINCYVKGPKPDGRYFSYGFPLNPGQVRKKKWTVGSKVYRVTKLGTKKLLAEIKAEDEGELVKLYQGN